MKLACDAPLGASCNDWGVAHAEGWGMPASPAHAALLFRQACDNHEVAGCASYAEVLLKGAPGVARDPNRALTLLGRACSNGSFKACYGVGLALSEGLIGEPRPAEAASYLRYACGYKLPQACNQLAFLLDSGVIGTNLVEARQLSEFACSQGVAAACVRLSGYYERGVAIAPNSEKAAELLARACKLGESQACVQVAPGTPGSGPVLGGD
jgi:TPR repeat protein